MGQRRARGLHEDVGERLLPLGGRPPALGDVLGVVAGQEQELRRAGDRHQELDVVEGDRQLAALDHVEAAQPGVELPGLLEVGAVGGQEVEQVLGRRQDQLHAGVATVGLGRLVDRDHHVVAVKAREDDVIETEPAKTHPVTPDSAMRRTPDAGDHAVTMHQAWRTRPRSIAGSLASLRLSIMTCAADGVEKASSSRLGHGAKVEQDGPPLDARDHGRIAHPEGPGPRPLRAMGRRERRRDRHGRRRDRPDRHTPAADERFGGDDRGAEAQLGSQGPGQPRRAGFELGQGGADHPPERDPRRGLRPVADQAEGGLERGQRHLVDAEGAHQAGRTRSGRSASRLPTRIPHWGPPSSLSPEKSTRSAPAARPSATLGSSATPGGCPGARAPEPMSSIIHSPRSWASFARPATRGLLGEADDPVVAVVDPQDRGGLRADRPLVVREPRLVGRPHLAEPGARDLEDLRQPEAAADLDELTARDDHLAARRQGAEGQDRRGGVVVDDGRRLGTGQLAQEPRDARGAPAALAVVELELEVAVAPGHRGDRFGRLRRQRGPPQARVQQDARRVDHGPERSPLAAEDLPRPSGQAGGIDGGRGPTPQPRPRLTDRRTDRTDQGVAAAAGPQLGELLTLEDGTHGR